MQKIRQLLKCMRATETESFNKKNRAAKISEQTRDPGKKVNSI